MVGVYHGSDSVNVHTDEPTSSPGLVFLVQFLYLHVASASRRRTWRPADLQFFDARSVHGMYSTLVGLGVAVVLCMHASNCIDWGRDGTVVPFF
jgi:hypothetical protein